MVDGRSRRTVRQLHAKTSMRQLLVCSVRERMPPHLYLVGWLSCLDGDAVKSPVTPNGWTSTLPEILPEMYTSQAC